MDAGTQKLPRLSKRRVFKAPLRFTVARQGEQISWEFVYYKVQDKVRLDTRSLGDERKASPKGLNSRAGLDLYLAMISVTTQQVLRQVFAEAVWEVIAEVSKKVVSAPTVHSDFLISSSLPTLYDRMQRGSIPKLRFVKDVGC